MKNEVLINNAKSFAILIVKLFDADNKYSALNNQILRSGTSIGANICEAQYAQSTLDFVNKLEIALKECYETEYWLEIFYETHKITSQQFAELKNSAGTIRRMLIKIITKTKSSL